MHLQDILSWAAAALNLDGARFSPSDGLSPSPSPSPSVYSLFTFGDSYSTTSFNVSLPQPSPDNPMGNPSLGDGTPSDGINWVGYLTTAFNNTLTLNYNPAVWGATVDNEIIADVPGDLVYQVTQVFEPNYCQPGRSGPASEESSGPIWTSDSSLFTLWTGINDVYRLSLRSDPYDVLPRVISRYIELTERLHACGSRNFLFFNIPPCNRSPQVRSFDPGFRRNYTEILREYNQQLQVAVDEWSVKHPESNVFIYDCWSFFTEILDHPKSYGFEDSTSMGNGKKHIWWDDLHPTSALHKLLARDVAGFLGWLE
ncbi:SGNH/GDSL hydrolase family protein [Aspergillus stella-maris]|uniref:SGNH/GDSL hydrolase family protein n=1 Tax=Aspergillus stella-maris TaxID=1810926 RepID=UPI003CCDD6F1